MSGLKWTHKTTAKIAGQLRRLGIRVGARTVARLLDKLHFSLRVNCKKIAAGNRSSHRHRGPLSHRRLQVQPD